MYLQTNGNFEAGSIYKSNVGSYLFDILKQAKYPMLRSSPYISYLNQNYHTRISNDILLPYPRVEG